jgi:YVTN family beta-propeller protein
VIDPTTHSVVDTIPVGSAPTQIILSADNTLAYVCNQSSNTISVVYLPSNAVIFTFPVGSYPTRMALSADEGILYVTNSFDLEIGLYSTNTYIEVGTIPLPDTPAGITLSPDGSELYCAVQNSIQGNEGKLAIIETATNTVDTLLVVGGHPHDVMVNSLGAVYVTSLDDDLVARVDPATDLVATTAVGDYPTCLELDLIEGYYYTTNSHSGTLSKIDVFTNMVWSTFPVGLYPYGISIFPKDLGVEEFHSSDLVVYPNPNNGAFLVKLPESNGSKQTISLYTANGKRIALYTTTQTIFEINEMLSNGVYILSVESENGVSSLKVEVR